MLNRVRLAAAKSEWLSAKARRRLLRAAGMELDPTCEILPESFFGDVTVSIGRNTFVNRRCLYDGGAPLRIGDECAVGYNVVFCTITHEIGDRTRRSGTQISKPIVIEDGCWIGANATILPGVTVGAGCVIAAGAVVRADCERDSIYGGVPARRLGPVVATADAALRDLVPARPIVVAE
jgi:maltose O-acetyltransferase